MVRRVEKVEPNFQAVEISMRSSRVHVTVELGCTPIRNTSPPGGGHTQVELDGRHASDACLHASGLYPHSYSRCVALARRSFPGAARPRRTSTAASSGRPACCVLQITCLHVHLYPRVRSELIRCVTRPPPPPVLRPGPRTSHGHARPPSPSPSESAYIVYILQGRCMGFPRPVSLTLASMAIPLAPQSRCQAPNA